ncbi:hypothetical protein ACJX0J_027933, partial [Zea mays]
SSCSQPLSIWWEEQWSIRPSRLQARRPTRRRGAAASSTTTTLARMLAQSLRPVTVSTREPAKRDGRLHLRVPQRRRRRVDRQAALRRDRGVRRHPLRAAAPPRRLRLRGRLRVRRPVVLLHGHPQLRRLP